MEPATDTIILTDSTKPEKPKFDIQNVYETTLAKLKVKVSFFASVLSTFKNLL